MDASILSGGSRLHATRAVTSMILAVALGIALGCSSSEEDLVETEDLCFVYRVNVGESTEPDQDIAVNIEGALGGEGCVNIDSRRIRNRWIILPMQGGDSPGSGCIAPHAPVDTVVTLEPPNLGWVYVEVQSRRKVFVESTFVRSQPFLVGTFEYTAFDTLDAEIFWGSLWMTSPEPSFVTGRYEMVYRAGLMEEGPHTHKGNFYGQFANGQLTVSLGGANGIHFSGIVDGVGYQGTWADYAFRGVTARGTFKAERVSGGG